MQEKNTLGYDYVKFWSSIDKGFNLIEDYSVKDIQFFVNNKKMNIILPISAIRKAVILTLKVSYINLPSKSLWKKKP